MQDFNISTHNFENAKNSIKKFSEQSESEIKLSRVNYEVDAGEAFFDGGGGLIGLLRGADHKVTGSEFNILASQVQNLFIDINKTQIKSIRELGEVYKALEALDKDYIQAIIGSLKATERTSERIQDEHKRINKVVDDQKRTLSILKAFKEKLEGFAHLEEVDELWNKISELNDIIPDITNNTKTALESGDENKKSIMALTSAQKSIEETHKNLKAIVDSHIERINSIIEFTENIEKLEHLYDVDKIWTSLLDISDTIEELKKEFLDFENNYAKKAEEILSLETKVKEINSTTNAISIYLDELKSIEHLREVDVLWKTTNSNKENITRINEFVDNLNEMNHINEIDDIWKNTKEHSNQLLQIENQTEQNNKELSNSIEELSNKIENIEKAHLENTDVLLKKIKTGYLIAGGALSVAIVEFIVLLVRLV